MDTGAARQTAARQGSRSRGLEIEIQAQQKNKIASQTALRNEVHKNKLPARCMQTCRGGEGRSWRVLSVFLLTLLVCGAVLELGQLEGAGAGAQTGGKQRAKSAWVRRLRPRRSLSRSLLAEQKHCVLLFFLYAVCSFCCSVSCACALLLFRVVGKGIGTQSAAGSDFLRRPSTERPVADFNERYYSL